MKKNNKEQVLKLIDACKKNCEDAEKDKIDKEDAMDNVVYYLDEIREIVKKD